MYRENRPEVLVDEYLVAGIGALDNRRPDKEALAVIDLSARQEAVRSS